MDIRLKYGLATGTATGIWMMLYYQYLFTTDAGKFLGFAGWIIMVAGIYSGIKEVKEKKFGGTITFSQGILQGLIITFCISVVMSLLHYIYIAWINPEYIGMMIDNARSVLAESDLPSEEKEKYLNNLEKNMTIKQEAGAAFIGSMMLGIFFSIPVALILRNKDAGPIADTEAGNVINESNNK